MKNSLWIEDRTEFAKYIEDYFEVKKIPVKTEDVLKYLTEELPESHRRKYPNWRRWFFGQRGFQWTLSLMLALFAFLTVLGLLELIGNLIK